MVNGLPICPRCGSARVTRHATPQPSEPYAQILDEAYLCGACGETETWDGTSDNASYEVFRNRWGHPVPPRQTAEEIAAWNAETRARHEERDREWAWPVESHISDRATRAEIHMEFVTLQKFGITRLTADNKYEHLHVYPLPTNDELLSRILSAPDDDAPRIAYAAWLRTVDHPLASGAADFIDGQLAIYRGLRVDPRQSPAVLAAPFPEATFTRQVWNGGGFKDIAKWWRLHGIYLGEAFGKPLDSLESSGLVDCTIAVRGFDEHVAMRASRFLELADELYSLAPIRHLTLTYCKGRDHQDVGLWKAVLESPHLDRIRTLRIWKRVYPSDNQYTELNRFTDDDLELLAASKHVRALAYLELTDQRSLTLRGFDALARSKNLPALSFVGHDFYEYGFPVQSSWGPLGQESKWLLDRGLHHYVPDLERRFGRLPWLHPVDSYGSEDPDFEAVVAHPVALDRPSR